MSRSWVRRERECMPCNFCQPTTQIKSPEPSLRAFRTVVSVVDLRLSVGLLTFQHPAGIFRRERRNLV